MLALIFGLPAAATGFMIPAAWASRPGWVKAGLKVVAVAAILGFVAALFPEQPPESGLGNVDRVLEESHDTGADPGVVAFAVIVWFAGTALVAAGYGVRNSIDRVVAAINRTTGDRSESDTDTKRP